jgi:hypothetical protein
MPLPWPGVSAGGGNLEGPLVDKAMTLLNAFGDKVAAELTRIGIPKQAAVIFRRWSIFGLVDQNSTSAVFSVLPGGGVPDVIWLHAPGKDVPLAALIRSAGERGLTVSAAVSLPNDADEATIAREASVYVAQVERDQRFSRLGDISGFPHLEQPLRAFLGDHPEPSKNVFLMMRFDKTEQLDEITATLRTTLGAHGLTGVRADDRAYADELWPNVQTYMLGSDLGIAVFEEIDHREFNPNISLELGFMFGRAKRCLLLKEKRMAALHADLVGKLYKPFDAFKIEETIRTEVARWIEIDLGLR